MAAVKEGNEMSSSITPEDISSTQRVIALIQNEFKVFECSSCQKNFGFQMKKDPNLRFCDAECVAAGLQRVFEILKGKTPSDNASPMNSPSPLLSSTKFSNGFSDVGSGKSCHPQSAPNEDRVKARLLNTLQTGGAGGGRNGAFTNGRAPPSFSSDRGRGGRSSSGRQSYEPSENPFYRGSDQVDKGTDFHSSGPSQKQLDAAFTRNSAKEALENTGFSTVEQEERDRFINLAKTPDKTKVQPEDSPVANNSNPLFERPKLKPIPTSEPPVVVKPKATTAPQLLKLSKPSEQDKERTTTGRPSAPILKTISKPSEPEKRREAPPAEAKPVEVKKAVSISESKPPVAAAKIYNMSDVMLSTSLYDLAPCNISYPWSAVKFTVNAAADVNKIEDLQSEVNVYARAAPGLARVPAINDVIIAPYEGDFYRARVVKVDEKTKEVLASFIDFGDSSTVKISDCKEPLDSIMKKHPVYGVIFSLALDIEVPESFALPENLNALLEHQVSLKIEEREIDDWKGILTMTGNRSLNDAVRDLIKPKVAPTPAKVSSNGAPTLKTVQPPQQGAKSTPVLKTIQTPAPKTESAPVLKPLLPKATTPQPAATPVLKPIQPKATTTPPPVAAPVLKPIQPKAAITTPPPATTARAPFIVKVGSKSTASKPSGPPAPPSRQPSPPPRSKWNIDTIKISPKIATEAHILFNYIWDMAKINISASEDNANLEFLQLAINKHIPTAPAMSVPPQIGDVVLAPYQGVYYRGRVGDVSDKGIDVIFLDYGDKTTASLAEVKEPNDEIMKHPIYGVILKVEGVQDDLEQMDHDDVNAAVDSGGQLELKDASNICCWVGQIWLDAEKNWETMVSDILKAEGK